MTIYQQQQPAGNDANMCRICYETMLPVTQGLVRPCGHDSFHTTCLVEWSAACRGRLRCPCCNQHVNEYMNETGHMVATHGTVLFRPLALMHTILHMCLAMATLQILFGALDLTKADKFAIVEWRIQSFLAIVYGHDETDVDVPAPTFRAWFAWQFFNLSRTYVIVHSINGIARAVELWVRHDITTARFLLRIMISTSLLLLGLQG